MKSEVRLIMIIMLCQDVLTNDVEVQKAVTRGGVSEVNPASEGKNERVVSKLFLTNLYSPDSFPLMLLTMRREVSRSLVWKVALSPK